MQRYTICIALHILFLVLTSHQTTSTDPTSPTIYDLCPEGTLSNLEYNVPRDSWIQIQTQNYPKPNVTNLNACYKKVTLSFPQQDPYRFEISYENATDTIQNTEWTWTMHIQVCNSAAYYTYTLDSTRQVEYYSSQTNTQTYPTYDELNRKYEVCGVEISVKDDGNGDPVVDSRGIRFNIYFKNYSSETEGTSAPPKPEEQTTDDGVNSGLIALGVIAILIALLVVAFMFYKVMDIRKKLQEMKKRNKIEKAADLVSKSGDELTDPLTANFFSAAQNTTVQPAAGGDMSVADPAGKTAMAADGGTMPIGDSMADPAPIQGMSMSGPADHVTMPHPANLSIYDATTMGGVTAEGRTMTAMSMAGASQATGMSYMSQAGGGMSVATATTTTAGPPTPTAPHPVNAAGTTVPQYDAERRV